MTTTRSRQQQFAIAVPLFTITHGRRQERRVSLAHIADVVTGEMRGSLCERRRRNDRGGCHSGAGHHLNLRGMTSKLVRCNLERELRVDRHGTTLRRVRGGRPKAW